MTKHYRHYRDDGGMYNAGLNEARRDFLNKLLPLEDYVEWLTVELVRIQAWADKESGPPRTFHADHYSREVQSELDYICPSLPPVPAFAHPLEQGLVTRERDGRYWCTGGEAPEVMVSMITAQPYFPVKTPLLVRWLRKGDGTEFKRNYLKNLVSEYITH